MSGLMITDQSYQSIVENREDAVICVCPTLKTHLAIPKKLTFGNPNHPNAALNLKWKKNNSDRHITKSVRFWTLIQCSFILAFSRKHKKQNKKTKIRSGSRRERQRGTVHGRAKSRTFQQWGNRKYFRGAKEISLSYHTPWDNYDTAENKFFISPAILSVCLLSHKTAHWLLIS